MSQENVELTMVLTDAFNRREVEASLWGDEGVWSPAIEALSDRSMLIQPPGSSSGISRR